MGDFLIKAFRMVPRSTSSYVLIISLIIAIKCEPPPPTARREDRRHSSVDEEYSERLPAQELELGYNTPGDNSVYEQNYNPYYDYDSENYPTQGPALYAQRPQRQPIVEANPSYQTIKKKYTHINPDKKYSNLYLGHKGYGQYGNAMATVHSPTSAALEGHPIEDYPKTSATPSVNYGNTHHKGESVNDEHNGIKSVSFESAGYHTKGHEQTWNHDDEAIDEKGQSYSNKGHEHQKGHDHHSKPNAIHEPAYKPKYQQESHGHGHSHGPEVSYGDYGHGGHGHGGGDTKNLSRESQSHIRIKRGGWGWGGGWSPGWGTDGGPGGWGGQGSSGWHGGKGGGGGTGSGGTGGGKGSQGWSNSEVLVLGGDDDKKGEDGEDSGIIGNMMGYFKGMRNKKGKGKGDDDDEVIIMNTGGGGGDDHGGGWGGGGGKGGGGAGHGQTIIITQDKKKKGGEENIIILGNNGGSGKGGWGGHGGGGQGSTIIITQPKGKKKGDGNIIILSNGNGGGGGGWGGSGGGKGSTIIAGGDDGGKGDDDGATIITGGNSGGSGGGGGGWGSGDGWSGGGNGGSGSNIVYSGGGGGKKKKGGDDDGVLIITAGNKGKGGGGSGGSYRSVHKIKKTQDGTVLLSTTTSRPTRIVPVKKQNWAQTYGEKPSASEVTSLVEDTSSNTALYPAKTTLFKIMKDNVKSGILG